MKILKKVLIPFYLLALLATSTFPLLEINGLITILVIVRFISLLVYYLISSKKLNNTFLALIALNIVGDLIFVQNDFYSFLFSMSVFIVINLVFSYLIYRYLTYKVDGFKVVIIPVLIITILFTYVLISFLEDEGYLFFIYSLSLILLIYGGFLYFMEGLRKEKAYMLLGVLFLSISAIFTWLDIFIESNKYYAFFDTLFYGLSLLLITLAVIFEDNKKIESI